MNRQDPTDGIECEPGFARGIFSSVEIDPYEHQPPLDWVELFGAHHPVEVEIGCGKGRFLVTAAGARPGVNFLGVERAGKYYRRAVGAVASAELKNVRLMRVDGLDLLDRWIAPKSVTTIHVYFPDPWPKKRHHKRRVFRPALLELAARAMIAGGEFRAATDHRECEALIRELFAARSDHFAPIPWPENDTAYLSTHYAAKWERAGRQIWCGCYRLLV